MKKFIVFSAILFSFFVSSNAQSLKEYKLEEITVSANRVETPALEVANTFTLITKEEIQKSGKSTLTEILREVPGISITEQGGPGRLSSIFTRGANTSYTLVLIDGVEVNDPSSPNGAFDFSSIPLANIERIEIVREPQSTLYGSDALAGIVNIITKKGGKNEYNLNAEAGSEKFVKTNLSASGSFGDLSYFLGYSFQQNEGISVISEEYGAEELDGYSNKNIQANLQYKISDNINSSFNYRYTFHKTELDRSGKTGDDPNYDYDIEDQLFIYKLNASLFNKKVNTEFSAGYLKHLAHSKNLPDESDASSSQSYNNANKLKFSLINNLDIIENNLITFGIETEEEKAYTNYYSKSVWGEFNSSFPESKARTTGVFLQDKISYHNFFFTAGVRYDSHNNFGSVTTYRIAPAYYISSTSTKLKATYATGFKTPSLFNLFDPQYGNPDLKPEKSSGFDFGVEQFLLNGNLGLEAVYFENKFIDLIGFDASFKPININKAKTSGYELSLTYKANSMFEAKLSYTYTKAVDESEGADNNEQLIRRPKDKALLAVSFYPSNKIDLSASIRYIGKRYDNDFSVFPSKRVELKEYTIADLTAAYHLFSNLKLYAKVDNIFDTKYEEVLYYGTLGRSFYFGLNITY